MDEVVPAPVLLRRPRRRRRWRWPTGRSKPGAAGHPARASGCCGRSSSARRAPRCSRRRGGHYPAPLEAIEVVEKGTATLARRGAEDRGRGASASWPSPTSRARSSRVFFATQEIKKDAGYPEGTKAARGRRSSAWWARASWARASPASAAEAGVLVRLKDASARGPGPRPALRARACFEERREAGQPHAAARSQKRMDRLSATPRLLGLPARRPRDRGRVRGPRPEAAGAGRGGGGHGRGLRVRQQHLVAAHRRRSRGRRSGPARVLGMHFFSPVHKMPLLEVVVTPRDGGRRHRHRGDVRPPARQTRDRGARRPRLLHHARRWRPT